MPKFTFLSVFSHDLNYGAWISKKKHTEGIAKIFEVAESLK
jgi:hypothetical protein